MYAVYATSVVLGIYAILGPYNTSEQARDAAERLVAAAKDNRPLECVVQGEAADRAGGSVWRTGCVEPSRVDRLTVRVEVFELWGDNTVEGLTRALRGR